MGTPQYLSQDGSLMGYDPSLWPWPHLASLDPCTWWGTGALQPLDKGRGTSWLIRGEATDWVLRHYRRGGRVAALAEDRYLYTGLRHTRAWREWHLLRLLRAQQMQVPAPAAFRVQRRGLGYRADIVTQRIPASRPLSALLTEGRPPRALWARVGAEIRALHELNVCHADLNAHNLLIDDQERVWLIDFDRGRLRRRGGRWAQGNLRRLQRSLAKIADREGAVHWRQEDWSALMDGYRRNGRDAA